MQILGKVIFKDQERLIEVRHQPNKKEYIIHRLKKDCYICNSHVLKSSGSYIQHPDVKQRFIVFLCRACTIIFKELTSK